ncbi:MAG TPA: hypothetical protein VN723_02400 [Rhizomicrobium sp.]|jgi:hypothetical protein|nr:hypothetical protein [Rhizomicrobium sp.]
MSQRAWPWPTLALLILAQWWLAHAIVFFAHEYAHAFVAWGLGWKQSPFDLHFPPLSATVLLIQLGIDQNVNEAPIFAAGHGVDVGLIAIAGMVLGNGLITLPLSRWTYRVAQRREARGWSMLAFWCTLASIGNLIDYVPVRTFTLDSDMGSVQKGFGWSPWTIMIVLGIPTLIILIWFLWRILPATLRWLFPETRAQRIAVAILAMAALFGFYGAVGFLDGGVTARQLSMLSVFGFIPLTSALEIALLERRAA